MKLKISKFNYLISVMLGFQTLIIANLANADSKASVLVKVELSPVGSFEIKTGKVEGSGIKKGDSYEAKQLEVSVDNFDTGIDLRNTHLKEKLEHKKFPKVKVTEVVAKDGKGSAKIIVKDITKKVEFAFKDLGGGLAEANFELNLKDFNFSGINYMGVGVEDNVKVIATIAYEKK